MRFIQPIVIIIIITLTALSHASDDDRGSVVRIQSEYDGATLRRDFMKGTNHALIIGVDRYRHHRDLKTAAADAHEVERLLKEKYYFLKTLEKN